MRYQYKQYADKEAFHIVINITRDVNLNRWSMELNTVYAVNLFPKPATNSQMCV